jgi:nitrogen fixation NifU-like protein
MGNLKELYTEVITFHNKKPRNFRKLESATREQEGYNPLCGDQITLYLEMDGETIKDIGFQGDGCSISRAAASMMTSAVKGRNKAEAEEMFSEFHRLAKGELNPDAEPHHLGHVATAFSNVHKYPARVKCASLAWHTLHAALEGRGEAVSTEQEER